jgi:hypothetical protein
VISELLILGELYGVSRQQAAIEGKSDDVIASLRRQAPAGSNVVRQPNGGVTVLVPPKVVRPGVMAFESTTYGNWKTQSRDASKYSELETKRLLLISIALVFAIPTAMGLILNLVLGRSTGPSTAPPTEPVTV